MYITANMFLYLITFSCCITGEPCTDLYRKQTEHPDMAFPATALILEFEFKFLKLQHI
uniref:Uncharacterized protein n=1 Tax=Peromyscus maniculatus bairdii TaxID=230844 RepID=A0A8C8UJ42_PERMB